MLVKLDSFISPREIAERIGISCSKPTVCRFLKREGIQHFKAIQRPLLSEDHAYQRFEWAKEHLNKGPEFWNRVIFSDETTIARGSGQRRGWVFCKYVSGLSEALPPYYTKTNRKTGGTNSERECTASTCPYTSLSNVLGRVFVESSYNADGPPRGSRYEARGGH